MMETVRTRILAAVSAAGLVVVAAPAVAAEPEQSEIVITARKRAESQIEVPDAVTVFTAQTIENAGINDVTDFANLTPNMFFTPTFRPAEMQMTIRGIPTAQGGEAPVAVVIDGVQVSHPTFVNQELLDIEQIEVLRGPQGSLYGRNAIGGALNITTRRPTNELEGMVRASYASGNDIRVGGAISGPLVKDKLLFRLAASMRDYKGQLRDQTARDGDRKADYDENYLVKAGLIFTPTDRLEINLRGNYLHQRAGAPSLEVVTNANFDDYGTSLLNRNVLTYDKREIYDLSLKADYDFGAAMLTWITGYSRSDAHLFGDADFSPTPFLLQDLDLTVKAFTQELRLSSQGDGWLRWLVGLYYQKRDTDNFLLIPFDDGTGQSNGTFAIQSFDAGTSKSIAAFGSTSADVSDDLELTLGMRYDRDKRRSVDTAIGGASEAGDTFEAFQPKLQLKYKIADDLNVFASYGRGFRSGGFNAFFAAGADRQFNKERSDSFEVGMKGDFLDRRLTFSASAFHIKFDNQQFFFITVSPPSQNVVNIDKVDISGLEVELAARPTSQLTINAGFGLSDATIKRFSDAAPALYKDNRAPQSPAYTASLSMDYVIPLADEFDVRFNGSFVRRGSIMWDAANTLRTPARNLINARLFVERSGFSIGAYVDNLTNARYPTQALANSFGDGLHSRIPSPKRQFGVQGSYKF
ncbi:TonB-dependent receptor [Sphingosinicella microcystinivorans]|uniref:TonB-dependent receptor n=2 Tax=Sphingosinicella microcystinivorans TaxID=335406 RepID=A0AAD1G0T8_SPHMI|nr:TonB-dependent receptor [Sphingosinicella microcystinivorans]BBE33911.1 TonB-dependent receptor [Sphingosinicella microcystinivorans]